MSCAGRVAFLLLPLKKLKKASYDERKTTRVYKIREPTLKTTSSLIITENSKFISATEIKAAGDSLWSCSDGGGDGAGVGVDS